MITLRRAGERHHIQHRKRDVWLTFYPLDRSDPLTDGFGALELLNEDRLAPGASSRLEPCHDAEIVTYVLEGALAHKDSTGLSGIIQAGEFQRRTGARGIQRSESNASRSDGAHVFHIWLRPSQVEREPSQEQMRFPAADRRGVLRVIASPDGRRGSLRLHQDAQVYTAVLDPGQHLVHELQARRRAWLHIARGEATFGDLVLTSGDGAGVAAERSVSLTARESSEIFLIDLGDSG
jgi:redox-sensitive bicupin YhaK (pirin superfamily)